MDNGPKVPPPSGGFSINYNAILERIKQVSYIDSEVVYFVKNIESDCPDCVYDPIRKRSANSFCPTCGGEGVIKSEEKTALVASVDRSTGFENSYQLGGRLPVGSVVVTIHESQLVGNGYDLDSDWVSVADYIEVAGKKYKIADGDSVIPQALNGQVYEIIFHLSLI